MRIIYTFILYLLTPFITLRLFWKSRANPGYRDRWRERFGYFSGSVLSQTIWIHAVSVGEVQATQQLIKKLHDEFKIRGVTVFRGVSGFGESGKLHEASLIDLSLDLPVVIEFFDAPEKIQPVLNTLKQTLKPGHYIYWSANTDI